MVHVVAHRGFSVRYPENTEIAFVKALELGVDAQSFLFSGGSCLLAAKGKGCARPIS